MSKMNFESLILSQSQKLHAGEIEQFVGTWNACASELLEFYGLDRLTVYPNSPILLRDQKTLSSARETIPPCISSIICRMMIVIYTTCACSKRNHFIEYLMK